VAAAIAMPRRRTARTLLTAMVTETDGPVKRA